MIRFDKMYVRLSSSGIIEVIMLFPFEDAIEVVYDDNVFFRPWDFVYNGHSFISTSGD